MREEDGPISMKSLLFPSETEGEIVRSLRAMTYSSFFDGPVGRNSCSEKCLTAFKMVM